jgi:hypothetical protein
MRPDHGAGGPEGQAPTRVTFPGRGAGAPRPRKAARVVFGLIAPARVGPTCTEDPFAGTDHDLTVTGPTWLNDSEAGG